MVKKLVAIMVVCVGSCHAQTTPNPSPDAWKPLRFLIGTWEARTQGGSAGATSSGTYLFRFELRNHVLARHTSNKNTACQGPADFNCDHGDLLYIYQEGSGQALKAIYFDNEGHVIHYNVSAPTPSSAIFVSDSSQPGPQFRLSYQLKGSTMYGKFEIRPPGQAAFQSYLEWSGEKM